MHVQMVESGRDSNIKSSQGLGKIRLNTGASKDCLAEQFRRKIWNPHSEKQFF